VAKLSQSQVVSKVFINAIFQLFPAFNCISWLWTTVFYAFLSHPKKFRTQNVGGKQAKPTKLGEGMGVGCKRTTKDEIVTQSIS